MSTAYIKNLIDYNGNIIYPQTKASAVYDDNGNLLSDVIPHKPTTTAVTMSASSWNSTEKTYSFEADYPNATYDVEIEINGDSCTDEQLEAWSGAKIVGSFSSNVAKAKGEVPTVDIPIILTVVKK